MDIDLLSKMIRELILDSDEVTLPGIGTFVTEIIPATFSDKGYTINPPYRRLFFRERIDGGEDALIDFYAASNDIPKEQASKIITDFLTGMMGVLREKKAVIFPGLGRLRATKENNLFFVADEDLDIWPAGFGLEPISLKTHVETAEEVGAAVSSLRSILDATEKAAEETTAPSTPVEALEIESDGAASSEATSREEAAIAEATAEPEVAEAAPEVRRKPTAQPEEDAIEEKPAIEEKSAVKEESGEDVQPPIEEGDAPAQRDTQEEEKEEEQPAQDAPEPKRRRGNGVKIMLWTLLVLAIILAAYVIAGHMGLMDSLLYSPEELEFMRQGGL